jgi:hypothetical protein
MSSRSVQHCRAGRSPPLRPAAVPPIHRLDGIDPGDPVFVLTQAVRDAYRFLDARDDVVNVEGEGQLLVVAYLDGAHA